MQWKGFALGFGLAGAMGVVGMVWLGRLADRTAIYWPPKTFYDDRDTRPGSGYVAVDGSLTGKDMDGSTFVHVECRREQMTCRINELHQWASPKGVTMWNDEFAVRSWGAETIVAESEPPAGTCNHVKLVIVRATETAQYVRVPEAKADPVKCKALTSGVMTWTIGDQFTRS